MTYTIRNITTKKPVINAINRRPIIFATREHAETFAAGIAANFRSDDRNMGRFLPRFEILEA